MINNTDEELSVVFPEKPQQVIIAIKLLYIVLVLTVISAALNGFYNYLVVSENFSPGFLLCWVIIIPVYLLLVRKISDGKIWARNLLLIYFILTTFSFVWLSFGNRLLTLPLPLTLYTILVGIIGLIATIMLYLSPSQAWFESIKHKKETPEDAS